VAVGIVHVKEALTPFGVTWRGGWPISRRDGALVNRIDIGNVENDASPPGPAPLDRLSD
jgi:hypothetical protein